MAWVASKAVAQARTVLGPMFAAVQENGEVRYTPMLYWVFTAAASVLQSLAVRPPELRVMPMQAWQVGGGGGGGERTGGGGDMTGGGGGDMSGGGGGDRIGGGGGD